MSNSLIFSSIVVERAGATRAVGKCSWLHPDPADKPPSRRTAAVRLPIARQMVMDGRTRSQADTATTGPVNPQVRTRPGASANFRLCATLRHCWWTRRANETRGLDRSHGSGTAFSASSLISC